MGSKYRWFDFADSRNMQGDDAKVERLGQRQGIVGESSPLPGKPAASPQTGGSPKKTSDGGKKVITEAKKESAMNAAAQRKSFSAKRDRCKKGKSCGASCIFYRNDCILQLPAEISGEVTKVRNYLKSEIAQGNLTTAEAAKRFKQYTGFSNSLVKGKLAEDTLPKEFRTGKVQTELKERTSFLREGINGLTKDYPDPKERRQKMRDMVSQAFDVLYGRKDVAPVVSNEGIERMASKERQDKFKELTSVYDNYKTGKYKNPEEFSKALEPFAKWYRNQDVKDSEVHFMMGLMPPQVFTYLKSAGSSEIPGSYRSVTPKGDVIPSGKKMSKAEEDKAKSFLIMKIAMESGFKDVYTGEKLNLLSVDLEHLIPAGVAGANANIGNNWSLTNSRINRGKGEGSPDYLLTTNTAGWFNTNTSKTSGKPRMITFDGNGKLTEDGKLFHEKREEINSAKKTIGDDILDKILDPQKALASIALIPTNELNAGDRANLMGKVVSAWTDSSRTVAIGIQSAKEGSLRSVPKPLYWYGKDVGGASVGKALADKVAELQEKGDNGGLMKMGSILSGAQRKLLDLNEEKYKGNRVRETQYSTRTGLIDFLAPKIKDIQDEVLQQIADL
jgi:hypothetical protein